jgi:hypothetical protein
MTDDKDAEIERLKAFILAIAEHLAICSEELTRYAEKKEKIDERASASIP